MVWQSSEKNSELKILGGIFENNFISPGEVIELAKLPGREELLARVARSISAPLSNMVNVLEGNIKGLISVLAQRAKI